MSSSTWPVRFGAGFGAGLLVAYVDNFAFEGEVSPIVIVFMLLVVAAGATAIWGSRGWVTAASAWACVPLAHLAKHALGLPDTLQPNTYTSILMLAGFTLVVVVLGGGAGMLFHKRGSAPSNRDSGSA